MKTTLPMFPEFMICWQAKRLLWEQRVMNYLGWRTKMVKMLLKHSLKRSLHFLSWKFRPLPSTWFTKIIRVRWHFNLGGKSFHGDESQFSRATLDTQKNACCAYNHDRPPLFQWLMKKTLLRKGEKRSVFKMEMYSNKSWTGKKWFWDRVFWLSYLDVNPIDKCCFLTMDGFRFNRLWRRRRNEVLCQGYHIH